MNRKTIGNAIRTRRKSRKILQADLPEIAGISPRTLRDIEKGTANPELETLMQICQVLGMEIKIENTHHDFLLFGNTLDIKESRVIKIINEFNGNEEGIIALIDKSFLRGDIKEVYRENYLNKATRLRVKWGPTNPPPLSMIPMSLYLCGSRSFTLPPPIH